MDELTRAQLAQPALPGLEQGQPVVAGPAFVSALRAQNRLLTRGLNLYRDALSCAVEKSGKLPAGMVRTLDAWEQEWRAQHRREHHRSSHHGAVALQGEEVARP